MTIINRISPNRRDLILYRGRCAHLMLLPPVVNMVAGNGEIIECVGHPAKLLRAKRLKVATHAVDRTQQQGLTISRDTIYNLLQKCSKHKDLATCRRVHSFMVWSGLDSVAALGDYLIHLFASFGSLLEANLAFSKIAKPSIYTWSAIISAHVKQGESKRVVELYLQMGQEGIEPSKVTFLSLLKVCCSTSMVEQGKLIHDQIIRNRLESDVIVGSILVNIYATWGSLKEAQKVFDKLRNRDVASWGAIITGYTQHGHGFLALELYVEMFESGLAPDKVTYSCVLKACGSMGALQQGRLIHGQVIRSGVEVDMVVKNTLVNMYSKCGCLDEAHQVFDKFLDRNVVSWGTIIAGYVQQGHGLCALEVFEKMQDEVIKPGKVILLSVLKACGSIGAIEAGTLVHDRVISSGFETDVVVGTALIDMYGKCERLEEACKVFDKLLNRNVVSWNAIIAGYASSGLGLLSLETFERMCREGIEPDNTTFSCILTACGNVARIEQGHHVHDQIIRSGLQADAIIGNTLVDMYAKCGKLEEAQTVFNTLLHKDLGTWGAMIAGNAQHGHGLRALELFDEMQLACSKPHKLTFLSLLRACVSIGAIGLGKLIHDHIIRNGLELDVVLGNTLVDMYAKCGNLMEAHRAFSRLLKQDAVSWNVLIVGYVQHGQNLLAIEHFEKMQEEGIQPDKVAYSSMLKACISMGVIGKGKLVHGHIIKSGLESSMVVSSTLIDMYAKGGSLEEARNVFDRMPHHCLVSWGAMIAGYAQRGDGISALELYMKMQQEGMEPDDVTFLFILKACGSIGALGHGKVAHEQIVCSTFNSGAAIGSMLVDMYARCGQLEDAHKVFNDLHEQSVVAWNAMIAGYAKHGNWRQARQCLEDMQQQGLKPVSSTYTSVLAASSHAGHVEDGYEYFQSMIKEHEITPSTEHFICMVDLLGRAGHLEEAVKIIQSMPMPPGIIGWMSLLAACRTYGHMELGRLCFDQIALLDPNVAAGYVIMSNIYADAQMREEVHGIQEMRKCAGAWKKPGAAWIEVTDELHEFLVEDKIHPQCEKNSTLLKRMRRPMHEEGYVPDLDLVVKPLLDFDKDVLYGQCEKLAIACG